MIADTVITVDGLSKVYRLYESPLDRLKELVHPARRRYHRDFFALRELRFSVRRGETVGLVGRNGSGKSTLLKVLTGVTAPTSGSVFVRGRVSALLELGTGFNPLLSGIENVHFNGLLMGLSRAEIDARLERILAFADIGEYAQQPVKSYSSGMLVRLAFALAVSVDPEILIVDEALAVGDARFQAKCFDRMNAFKESGTTVIFVSHSLEQIVSHCSRAILLDAGQILLDGHPREVTNRYLDLSFGQERQDPAVAKPVARGAQAPGASGGLVFEGDNFPARSVYNPHEYRWGDGAALLTDFQMAVDGVAGAELVPSGSRVRLSVAARFERPVYRPIFGVTIKSKEGVTLYGSNSELQNRHGLEREYAIGDIETMTCEFHCNLAPGDYFVSVGLASSRGGAKVVPHDRRYDAIHLRVTAREAPRFSGLFDLEMTMEVGQREEPRTRGARH